MQEFETVVELGGVAAVLFNDRKQLFQVVTEKIRPHHRLARMHPVFITSQGVDLAVVDEIAVRMRSFPAREGVGAEARMNQGDSGFHSRIAKIGKVVNYLVGRQHPLVNDGPV